MNTHECTTKKGYFKVKVVEKQKYPWNSSTYKGTINESYVVK